MNVPLVDLRASFRGIRAELLEEFAKILDGAELLLGPSVRAFEQEFAEFCETEDGVAVSSGTDALRLALMACGITAGDEVIVPAHTFFASIESIIHCGAVPVMVDVEPDHLTIDPRAVEAALTRHTKAIVPVHLYGNPADMDPILEIARGRGLLVVEDAAQAHGARYRGRRCGSLGDAACFSFYFTKNLGAFGEGGFVTTGDRNIAERVRLLRHHGHVSKSEHEVVGFNHRMDELQAAVLRIKLRSLEAANRRRRQIAGSYRSLLPAEKVRHPSEREGCESVHHLYPIRVGDRDGLAEHLAARGVGTGVHYRIPGHRQRALRAHPHRCGNLDVTEAACRELLSIPMYPELSDGEIDYVARHVRGFFERPDGGQRGPG